MTDFVSIRRPADLHELRRIGFTGQYGSEVDQRTAESLADREPVLPPGAPLITQLGTYVLRAPGESTAMRCKLCPSEHRGHPVDVHAGLRAHHHEQHRGAIVSESSWRSDHEGRPRAKRPGHREVSSVPCSALMRQGERTGQPCGRLSALGLCSAHAAVAEMTTCQFVASTGPNAGKPCGTPCRQGWCKHHSRTAAGRAEKRNATRRAGRAARRAAA